MNLVLICSDTFRADYLGAYGNEWIRTPHLDRLAEESARFVDAYGEGLPTLPARRVMLTGRPIFPFYHYRQQSDQVQLAGWHPLYDEDVTLAETLRAQGYTTCFVTDVYHMMKPGKNFHRGFDCWYWIRGQEADPYQIRDADAVRALLDEACPDMPEEQRRGHWIVQHLMNRKDWTSDADTLVAQVMTKAADWIRAYTESHLNALFFLYVDCFDPHEPWDPPEADARPYYEDYSGLEAIMPPGTKQNMTEEEFARVKAAYAGEVTLTDRWIGHLLDTLRELGLMDDTLVVFTSDHGTMMGEQDEIHKGEDRVRVQCTRVPLLIRHPKGEGAGHPVRGFVQHQDIMPTALKLLDAEIPERVQGADIWPMLCGEGGPTRERIFSPFGRYASVRTRRWNYVIPWAPLPEGRRARHELYDLEADPEELVNVLDRHPDVAEELRVALNEKIAARGADTRGSFGPGQPVSPDDQSRL